MATPLVPRRIRRALRRLSRLVRAECEGIARALPLRRGTVLYESFGGNGALDNPEAIFREALNRPDLAHLHHIWAVHPDRAARFRAEFARHPRVRFVRPGSVACASALARSEFLINNATFPMGFQKRDGQRYLNTWHGTPLKRMGYDMPAGAFESANVLRNFVSADLLLSQNRHMTRMYTESYRLAGMLPGRILEIGYPRTDRQNLDERSRRRATADLAAAGLDPTGRRLVLYAPTWKGTDFGTPRDEAAALSATVRDLQTDLGDGYLVALKVHQAVAGGMPAGAGPTVPDELPTNVVLGMTDILITDYSSIFVDFVGTGRPVVFFTPDRDEYDAERGVYFAGSDLPGPVVTSVPQLAVAARHADRAERPGLASAERWRRDFTPRDDGRAAARAADALFHGRVDVGDAVPATARRPSVLLYLGGMRSNGITSSALNLLAHLDHDELEVSVLIARPGGREQRANAARIDDRVRQFHRRGGMNGRRLALAAMRTIGRLRPAHEEAAWERRLWEGEWRRCLGDTRFDVVIDFSGYSRFWAELVLHGPAARRLMWVHNDLAAEVHRRVAGRRRMRRSLPSVFALYPRFDALIAVSRELARLNAASLARQYGVPEEHFLSARNVIDDAAARRSLREPLEQAEEFRDPETGAVLVPSWARDLGREPGTCWFVTVGRLSPEKNHLRLLDAFAAVRRDHPGARLIIVGEGPERDRLERRRDERGLADDVVFAGALANPFAVLARADCFVLSSDYEGQPMVLLEAAVAGLPIVTVRFGSVADALDDDRMLVVDQSVEGLAQGMRDHLAGRVRPAELDPAAYNRRALREFTAVLGFEPSSDSSSSTTQPEISPRTSNATRASTISATTTTPPMTSNHHIESSSAGRTAP